MNQSLKIITAIFIFALLGFCPVFVSSTALKSRKLKSNFDVKGLNHTDETGVNITLLSTNATNNVSEPHHKVLNHRRYRSHQRGDSTFSNITDISFAKNYLTFTQLSKGLSSFQNVSMSFINTLSQGLGLKNSHYLMICVGITVVCSLVFLFFKNLNGEKLMKTGRLSNFLEVKSAKNNDKSIILKGRTIHRPANQYHYILEKSVSEERSEVSSAAEDNIPNFDENEISKYPEYQDLNQKSSFFSEVKFGKIFNNNNNTVIHSENPPRQFSSIDELFANTLAPVTEKKIENIEAIIVPEYVATLTNPDQHGVQKQKEETALKTSEKMEEVEGRKDPRKEKISYLLQNHICEETVITRCSIPMDFKFKNKISN